MIGFVRGALAFAMFQSLFVTAIAQENQSTSADTSITTPAKFEPFCNIHSNNPGFKTLNQSLPLKADTNWLHANPKEIQEWYNIGMKHCMAFLENHSGDIKHPIPAYYEDGGQIPMPGQNKCRGRAMLHELTGMLVWPFGPYQSCPTYSKCWFGLLTCGKPKNFVDQIKPSMNVVLKQWELKPVPMPEMGPWSIRSLVIRARVVGVELIVPEQRYFTLSNDKSQDDVIIAQYVTTIPSEESVLELRHFEFYPGELLQWTPEHRLNFQPHNYANIFLGENEGRCRTWTKCTFQSICCGCAEKSRVTNMPVTISIPDHTQRCNDILKVSDIRHTVLPYCKAHDSSTPGRWIQSSSNKLTPQCDEGELRDDLFTVVKYQDKVVTASTGPTHATDRKPPPPLPPTVGHGVKPSGPHRRRLDNEPPHFDKLKGLTGIPPVHHNHSAGGAVNDAHTPLSPHSAQHATQARPYQFASTNGTNHTRYHVEQWFSGMHCIVHDKSPEELGRHHWAYAPYTCKYHYYPRNELHQCLKEKKITNIQFHGDSMSRDLYSTVSQYLGVPMLDRDVLKKMTNEQKGKLLSVQSGEVILTDAYYWHFDENVTHHVVRESPPADVVIANSAFSHQGYFYAAFLEMQGRTEYGFWRDVFPTYKLALPRFRYYQNAKELQGLRTPRIDGFFSSNVFRQNSELLRSEYAQLGFGELDENLVTMGRYDDYNPGNDGWHFSGTKKRMEAVILFNMLCNDVMHGNATTV